MSSKRARRRRKGKRLEAAKVEKKKALKMWRKLAGTNDHPLMDYGLIYCPYIPRMKEGSWVIGDSSS